jgi:putative N-acetyltransferase (TIGR04045 family)
MRSELGLGEPAARTRGRHPAPPVGRGVVCLPARSAGERAEHLAIRHKVFVGEQAVFPESDLDLWDGEESTIAVLGYSDGIAVGTVRLFPLDLAQGRWQGDRLAVLSAYRTHGIGAPLVNYAVAAAGALGGRTMVAHIQPANIVFFRRLGWTRAGESEVYLGLPHQPMCIDLPTRSEGLATVRKFEEGINGQGP